MIGIVWIVAVVVFTLLLITTLITVRLGAPYVASSKDDLKNIVKLLPDIKNRNIVDLGSGDGRIMVELAKYGSRITGFEINPVLVLISKLRIKLEDHKSGSSTVKFGSFWKEDLGKYDIVIFYAATYFMDKLKKKLVNEVKNGAKVVSIAYELPGVKYQKKSGNVYLYEFPLK